MNICPLLEKQIHNFHQDDDDDDDNDVVSFGPIISFNTSTIIPQYSIDQPKSNHPKSNKNTRLEFCNFKIYWTWK